MRRRVRPGHRRPRVVACATVAGPNGPRSSSAPQCGIEREVKKRDPGRPASAGAVLGLPPAGPRPHTHARGRRAASPNWSALCLTPSSGRPLRRLPRAVSNASGWPSTWGITLTPWPRRPPTHRGWSAGWLQRSSRPGPARASRAAPAAVPWRCSSEQSERPSASAGAAMRPVGPSHARRADASDGCPPRTAGGHALCNSCRLRDPATWKTCSGCGRLQRVNARTADGAPLCPSCYEPPLDTCTTCADVAPIAFRRPGRRTVRPLL